MKVGFTGTRFGMSIRQQDWLRLMLARNKGEFHHGDCIGADAEAHTIAYECGWYIVIHPPSDPKLRAFCKNYLTMLPVAPYLVRNKDIVNNTDGLIVAPLSNVEEIRSGTWSTKRYAEKIGKPFEILKR